MGAILIAPTSYTEISQDLHRLLSAIAPNVQFTGKHGGLGVVNCVPYYLSKLLRLWLVGFSGISLVLVLGIGFLHVDCGVIGILCWVSHA